MKTRLAILGLLLGAALPARGSDIPWITLAYSPSFDEACAARLGTPHLFAVEQAVYERRGQAAELRAVEAFQARLIGGRLFGRAREIVQAEGIEPFLAELRGADEAAANKRF